jgi:prophage antirepressor-like protein
MEVVYKTYTSDEADVDCLIIKTGHKFWFCVADIATFLGYKNPGEVCFNVRCETWQKWGEFSPSFFEKEQVPTYWNFNTALISEVGLCRLLCKSTKPEAINFERWVFDEVLPKLREAGQYKLEKLFHEQLAIKDREIVKLRHKVLELYGKAAVTAFGEES